MPLSPHDIMYLAIALSVVVLTGFLCWLIFYAVQILKTTSEVAREMRDRLFTITTLLGDVASKIEGMYSIINSWSGFGDLIKNKVRSKAASFFGTKKTAYTGVADNDSDDETDADSADALEESLARTTLKKQPRRSVKIRS
jgi:hypothetical protein